MSTGAPIDKGVAIRMPSTALLTVDTNDNQLFEQSLYVGGVLQNPATAGMRIDTANPAVVYLNKQQALMAGYMTRVSLTEVCFDWRTPNLNDRNRYLTIALWYTASTIDPTILTFYRVAIPQAFYTLPELTKAMEFALNDQVTLASLADVFPTEAAEFTAIDWMVRWGYDIGGPPDNRNDYNVFIQMVPTIASGSTANLFWSIVPSNIPRIGVNTSVSPAVLGAIPVIQYDITPLIGLVPTKLSGDQWFRTIQSTGSSMQYTPYVDIVSNILTKNQNVPDNDSDFRKGRAKLCRLYLSSDSLEQRTVTATYATPGNQSSALLASFDSAIGCRPFKFRREFQVPKQIQWNTTENIDIIDLEVLDSLGNPIYITPTVESGLDNREVGNQADFQFTVQVSEV